MRVEHEAAGVGVEISTDRAIRRWVLFALKIGDLPGGVCGMEVGPGETVEWTTSYRFYAAALACGARAIVRAFSGRGDSLGRGPGGFVCS